MKIAMFFTIFFTVFLAELGDKTQIATLIFSTDSTYNRFYVFLASSFALVLSSFIAVYFSVIFEKFLSPSTIKLIGGLIFILIGIFMIIKR